MIRALDITACLFSNYVVKQLELEVVFYVRSLSLIAEFPINVLSLIEGICIFQRLLCIAFQFSTSFGRKAGGSAEYERPGGSTGSFPGK